MLKALVFSSFLFEKPKQASSSTIVSFQCCYSSQSCHLSARYRGVQYGKPTFLKITWTLAREALSHGIRDRRVLNPFPFPSHRHPLGQGPRGSASLVYTGAHSHDRGGVVPATAVPTTRRKRWGKMGACSFASWATPPWRYAFESNEFGKCQTDRRTQPPPLSGTHVG